MSEFAKRLSGMSGGKPKPTFSERVVEAARPPTLGELAKQSAHDIVSRGGNVIGGTISHVGRLSEVAGQKLASMAGVDPDYSQMNPRNELLVNFGKAISEYANIALPEAEKAKGHLVPEVVGSLGEMAAFGGVGGLARGKIAQSLTIGGMGALYQGEAEFEAARMAHEDPDSEEAYERAWEVARPNYAIGASESILAQIMGRWDKSSGGLMGRVLRGFAGEGSQEMLQQAATNIVARETYDKERSVVEGVVQSGKAAGLSGALFSLLTAWLPRKGPVSPPTDVSSQDAPTTQPEITVRGEDPTASQAQELVSVSPEGVRTPLGQEAPAPAQEPQAAPEAAQEPEVTQEALSNALLDLDEGRTPKVHPAEDAYFRRVMSLPEEGIRTEVEGMDQEQVGRFVDYVERNPDQQVDDISKQMGVKPPTEQEFQEVEESLNLTPEEQADVAQREKQAKLELLSEERRGTELEDPTEGRGEPDLLTPEQREEYDPTQEIPPEAEPGTEEIVKLGAFPGEVTDDVKFYTGRLLKKLRKQPPVSGKGTYDTSAATTRTLYQKHVDKMVPVLAAEEIARTKGAKDQPSTYAAEMLRRGRTKVEQDRVEKRFYNPIYRTVRSFGRKKVKLEDVDKFLIARTAEERNAAIAGRQKAFTKLETQIQKANEKGDRATADAIQEELDALSGGLDLAELDWDHENNPASGMKTSEAKAYLKKIQEGPDADLYEKLGKQFDRVTAETRKVWRESGLFSEDTIRAFEELYEHYAPLRTYIQGETQGRTRGMTIGGEEVHKAKGRKSMADSPLAFGLAQLDQAIIRAEKNKVGQRLLQNVQDNPEAWGFVKVIGPNSEHTKQKVKNYDNTLGVKVEGQLYRMEFDPEYANVAQALKHITGPDMDAVTNAAGSFSRFLAQASTRWNPGFAPANLIRDVFTGFIHSSEHGLRFATKVTRDVPKALLALSGRGSKEWQGWADRYKQSGAPITFLDLGGMEAQLKTIEKELASAEGGTLRKSVRGFKRIVEVVENFSDLTENGTRLSYFRHAIEDLGMTDEQAALAAKDLTVNFERRGDLGNHINAWFMFSQAGVQGIDRMRRAMKVPMVKKLVASGVIGAMFWDHIARAMMGEDEDGEDRWDKIPEYEKRSNFIIPTGWLTGDDYDRITIPMPRMYSFFAYAGMKASAYMAGEEQSKRRVMGDLFQAGLLEFSPVGEEFYPTIAQIPIQILTNRDWKGDPIRPTKPFDKGPVSHRVWPDANPSLVAVTQWLNRVTGGDEFTPGIIDWNAQYIEHGISNLFGGAGATVTRALDTLGALGSGEIPDAYRVPVLRRFVKGSNPFQSSQDFGEALDFLEKESSRAKSRDETFSQSRLLEDGRKARNKIREISRKADKLETESEKDKLYRDAESVRLKFLKRYREEMDNAER